MQISVTEFITLDGYIVGPDEDINWVIDGFDPEMQEDIAVAISETVDVFVFGRVTYDIFAPYWPQAQPYAPGEEVNPSAGKEDARIIRALNESPKVVFSTTLEKADWNNTRLLRGGLEDEIRRLKAEPGRAVCIQGSASVVRALARADLIDEYVLYVHPIVLGGGTRLFSNGETRRKFGLARSKTYPNGVVCLRYTRTASS